MSLFRSPTNSSGSKALGGYQLQTSIFGQGLQIVIGTARITGTVIWVGDWTSKSVSAGGKLGGKGSGGGKGGSGQYNYSASFIIALCQGRVAGYNMVWQDRSEVVPQSVSNPAYPTYFANGDIGQSPWPYLVSSQPANQALGYSEVALGCYQQINLGSSGSISNYSYEIAGLKLYETSVVNVGAASGGISAITWVSGQDFTIFVPNQGIQISGHTAVVSSIADTHHMSVAWAVTGSSANQQLGWPDALCSEAIYLILNDFNLANIDSSLIRSMAGTGGITNYCLANGIGVSPVLNQQNTLASYLTELLLVSNSEAYSSEGLIKFATYGDKAITGNGVTFTPDLTPVYNLGLDDFITGENSNAAPVKFSRVAAQDVTNRMTVEWTNRGNAYNLETMTDEDSWSVQQIGRNNGSTISVHSVCQAPVAQQVLTVQLKRAVYITRKASFTVGWAKSILEPMDIVTVPEQYPSNSNIGVRILTIDEDDNGNLAMTGEVIPFPILNPALHPKQGSGGFTAGFNTLPGATNKPIFFEANPQMLNQNLVTQLTLFIALSGGPNWGGSAVYVSTDGGSSYEILESQNLGSPVGILSAGLPYGTDPDIAHTLSVNLQQSLGTLDSFTQTQADNNVSLCCIDQELLSWETATLTGPNQYDLTYLRRGVYESVETSHQTGASFAALDSNAFQYQYSPGDIGKTVYFKFPAFNKAQQQQQDVATVTAYPWTLTAPATRGPLALKPLGQTYPFAPSGYSPALAQANGGATIQISAVPAVNSFSQGATAPVIDFTAMVTPTGGSIPQGSFVGQVFAIDGSGNYSTGSNLTEFVTINGTSQVTFNVMLPAGAVGYEAFFGPDIDTLYGQLKQVGTPTSLTFSTLLLSGYGPPDGRAVAYHARGKRVIHGGIAAAVVVSHTSSTVTIGIPSAATLDEFAGRYLILVSKAGLPASQPFSETFISGNDTGSPNCVLNVGLHATLFGAGDLVLISTAATSITSTSITDTGWVSPYAPGGLTPDASTGNILRVIYDPTGVAQAGDTVTVTGNTSTSHTVTPWARQPGTGTLYEEEEPTWRTNTVTAATVNSVAATLASMPVQVAALPTTDLQGYVALVELLVQDANGNDSIESGNGLRMIYVVPQATPGSSSETGYMVPVTNGLAQPDLSRGSIQIVVMGTGAGQAPDGTLIAGPLNYSMSANTPWTLIVRQTTGGMSCQLDSTYATNYALASSASPAATECKQTLSTNSSGNTGPTAPPTIDQPIPA